MSRKTDKILFDECRAYEDKLGLTPCSMAGFLQNEGCIDVEFQKDNLQRLKIARVDIQVKLNETREAGNRLLSRLYASLGERMLQKDKMLS